MKLDMAIKHKNKLKKENKSSDEYMTVALKRVQLDIMDLTEILDDLKALKLEVE